jgi:hypothetical protein
MKTDKAKLRELAELIRSWRGVYLREYIADLLLSEINEEGGK